MSIKTNAEEIRDETGLGANTATRVGGNLVEIAEDLIIKETAIDANTAKVGITTGQASAIADNTAKVGISTLAQTIQGVKTFSPTVTATANNQELTALFITPTFVPSSFTGIKKTALKAVGNVLINKENGLSTFAAIEEIDGGHIVVSGSSINQQIGLYGRGGFGLGGAQIVTNSGTLSFVCGASGNFVTDVPNFSNAGAMKMFATGNLVLKNSNISDNGVDKLQVEGSAKIKTPTYAYALTLGNPDGDLIKLGGGSGGRASIASLTGEMDFNSDITNLNRTLSLRPTGLHLGAGYGKIFGESSQNFIDYSEGGTGNLKIATTVTNPITFLTNNVERMRINTVGDVGIGTNSPLSILQVKGKTGVTSFKGTARTDITIEGSANLNEFNGIDFLSFGQTAPLGRIALKATSDGSQMSFGTTNSFSGGVTKEMTFDEFGRLKVNAGNLSMQGYNLLTGDGTETSFAYIGLKAARADIYFGQVSTGANIMGVAGGQAFFANGSEPFTLGTLNDKSLILGTNSLARINISGSTGNVLINTTTDNGVDKLQVNGSGNFKQNLTIQLINNTAQFKLGDGEYYKGVIEYFYGNRLQIDSGFISDFVLSSYGNENLRVKYDGNVLIATSTDNLIDKLQVNGSVSVTTLKTSGFTVATLPTPPAQGEGARAHVTDASNPTYLGTLTGGGTVKCPVFYNGTSWVSA